MLERLKKHTLYVLGQFDFYGFPHPTCSDWVAFCLAFID